MVPANNNNYNNGYNNYNNNSHRSNTWLPDIFDDFFGHDWNWLTTSQKATPAYNVTESDKAYTVEVAVPGIRKEDCKIRLNDDVMTISVEKQQQLEEDGKKRRYLRKEFSYSKFEQSFSMPEEVDQKGVKAEVKDGVLTISLPKKEVKKEEEKWQNIEVQ